MFTIAQFWKLSLLHTTGNKGINTTDIYHYGTLLAMLTFAH